MNCQKKFQISEVFGCENSVQRIADLDIQAFKFSKDKLWSGKSKLGSVPRILSFGSNSSQLCVKIRV